MAVTPSRRRPSGLRASRNLVYAIGACVLISKTRSRLAPPIPRAFDAAEFSAEPPAAAAAGAGGGGDGHHRIPRIIHQSYKSLASLPEEWADTPSRWQELHPSYEYKFWSDEDNRDLVKEHYPWFLETYDAYPAPIQRADAARYLAVLRYGGIYSDMDVLPIRNVDALLDVLDLPENAGREMIVAETHNLGLTNALFAAVPDSAVLGRFVREELPAHAARPLHGFEALVPHFAVLLSTGPTRLWMYLGRHGDRIRTLPPAGWGQCHQCIQRRGQCVPEDGSYFETRKGGSWHKCDTRIMNFIFCHVHFCVWGGVCALAWLCHGRMARRRRKGSRRDGEECEWDDGAGSGETEDAEQGTAMRDAAGKKRRWNPVNASAFMSLENASFVAQMLLSRHRFPLFCGVILLLLL